MIMRSALPIGIVSVVLQAACSEPGTDTAATPEPQVQTPTGTPPAPRTEFRIPPETRAVRCTLELSSHTIGGLS